jgi:hypothetical protein
MNDRITQYTLSSTTKSNYVAMTFAYTAVPYTGTYSYGGVTNTVTADMKKITFKSNTYTRNTATGGMALIDITGVPRVLFDSETFTNNGDSTSNSLSLYGSGVLTSATSEMSIDGALASTATYPSSVLCVSMISVVRMAQVEAKGNTFNGNWLLETAYDSNRA